MSITRLHVAGYRSVRDLDLPLGPVNVLVGPNGCGKTNLYRAVYLLTVAAQGRLAAALVEEGGVPSVLWAGRRRHKEPVRLTLGVQLAPVAQAVLPANRPEPAPATLGYELSCGIVSPTPGGSMFDLDPEVKEERVWFESSGKVVLMDRRRTTVMVRDAEGRRASYPMALLETESALSQLREPGRYPQLAALREQFLGWRFYHHFRAFPGASLAIDGEEGYFHLLLKHPPTGSIPRLPGENPMDRVVGGRTIDRNPIHGVFAG